MSFLWRRGGAATPEQAPPPEASPRQFGGAGPPQQVCLLSALPLRVQRVGVAMRAAPTAAQLQPSCPPGVCQPTLHASLPRPQGTPLELIKYDAATGKFELGAQALAVLKATRGPVGVVAVCGRARQGKSFILNQLLGHSGGFQVRRGGRVGHAHTHTHTGCLFACTLAAGA